MFSLLFTTPITTDTAFKYVPFFSAKCWAYSETDDQGDDADVNKEPAVALQKVGLKRKLNSCQAIPRASKELEVSPVQYDKVCHVLEDVLNWQSHQVCYFHDISFLKTDQLYLLAQSPST